jgi:hypothetical protein
MLYATISVKPRRAMMTILRILSRRFLLDGCPPQPLFITEHKE